MNLPSVKTLSTITDTPDETKLLRSLLETYRAKDSAKLEALVRERYPHTAHWAFTQCYNRPRNLDITLAAANELLGTHGVEAVFARHTSYNEPPALQYLNTGDPYYPTLCYAHSFYVACPGDFMERTL